jgi:hypothetical protein
MDALSSVRATLAERWLFNFRLPPEVLARYLPVDWLVPQCFKGYAVASFCVLDLRNVMAGPLPRRLGVDSLCCAPRYGVIDLSGDLPEPAVFMTGRRTDSLLGAWYMRSAFAAVRPSASTQVDQHGQATTIQIWDADDQLLFAATVQPAERHESQLFNTAGDFADFIAGGVSSYGLCARPGRLSKIDLHKPSTPYQPRAATMLAGSVVQQWQAAGGVLDSVFWTSGGEYRWVYNGLTAPEAVRQYAGAQRQVAG